MPPARSDLEESSLVTDPRSSSPLKRWILLDGNRIVLSVVLAAGLLAVLLALFGIGLFRPTDGETVGTLLTALIGGTLPFITIVLAVIQLVLSQELGWPEGLRDRFEGAEAFREDVEAVTGVSVSPASPAAFLRVIVEANAERAAALPGSLRDDAEEGVRRRVERYAEAVVSESERVSTALADADLGTFDALSAVLGHHHGEHYHRARRLRVDHADEFETTTPLAEMVELMKHLAVARQTFKTMYVQHELATLSRRLLYVGLPTLVGGGVLVLVYPTLVETVAGRGPLLVVAAAGITLVFLPFVVLLSHTLRIATIAARTGDFGPFVPRSAN